MSDTSTARRFARVTLALTLTVPLLTGCALLEGPTPETPKRQTQPVPDAAPEFFPDGTAEDNLPYFTELIRAYSTSEASITGKPVAQAVIDGGFDKTMMQFSFDESKTGLVADNIFVSVRIGADCLIGQLVTADRGFVTAVEPAVGPAADICLIGTTRSVDW